MKGFVPRLHDQKLLINQANYFYTELAIAVMRSGNNMVSLSLMHLFSELSQTWSESSVTTFTEPQ